jgi:hypothetical protein
MMTLSHRFWRSITVLVRVDIAAGMTGAAFLLLWLKWH